MKENVLTFFIFVQKIRKFVQKPHRICPAFLLPRSIFRQDLAQKFFFLPLITSEEKRLFNDFF